MTIDTCYYCGSREHNFYAEENGFHLVKCTSCGLLYVRDRPDEQEISQAHMQGLHKGKEVVDITGSYSRVKASGYRNVLHDLFGTDTTARESWLDVGCGHGEFMEAVQRFFPPGLHVTGTEPNVRKQAGARQRGLDVSYFELESHTRKYDVVSLLNVYSHLPNPPAFLQSLKTILKPKGELIIETGDTAALSAKDHYRPFYLPDHLSFASESIVRGILENLDFEIVAIRKYPSVKLDPIEITKEAIKLFLPRYKSRLSHYLHWKRYSETDMYIRARSKS